MLQDITEISDGKIYGVNDMVKAACNDCAGCHSCCEGMGDTILPDPYDVWRLTLGLGKSFQELLDREVELKQYHLFLMEWHTLKRKVKQWIAEAGDEKSVKTANLFLLRLFFLQPYEAEKSFYEQFSERMETAKNSLNL